MMVVLKEIVVNLHGTAEKSHNWLALVPFRWKSSVNVVEDCREPNMTIMGPLRVLKRK